MWSVTLLFISIVPITNTPAGTSTVPPWSLLQTSIAACRAAVSRVIPSPFAPKSRMLYVRVPRSWPELLEVASVWPIIRVTPISPEPTDAVAARLNHLRRERETSFELIIVILCSSTLTTATGYSPFYPLKWIACGQKLGRNEESDSMKALFWLGLLAVIVGVALLF